MNIGDKVRLLHSNDEGIITKIVSEQVVEIEIEDGFHIPVPRKEVVLIAREEADQFGAAKKKSFQESISKKMPKPFKPDSSPPKAQQGIYLAFVKLNHSQHLLYLINNTDYHLPFVFSNEKQGKITNLYAEKISPKEFIKIHAIDIQNLKDWGVFIFQCLFFAPGDSQLKDPFIKKIRFRPDSFFAALGSAPLLQKEAYTFQLDKDLPKKRDDSALAQVDVIDPQKLKEQMLEKKVPSVSKPTLKAPKLEVDLHIEALTRDYESLNSAEILDFQLKAFEQNLEGAIATGMREIVFIHGVGNGKLRKEIHRRLSGHPDINYFKDARKEKFGYGATLLAFK